MNKHEIGAQYEEKAARYLEAQGYRIVERNYRCKLGEIDLVARDGTYLVFGHSGYGLDSVDARKQRRITRAASWYLYEKHIREGQPCRFDVVSFLGDEAMLLRDAFQL